MRRNHQPFFVRHCVLNCRHQIRKRFPHPRPRLRYEMTPLPQRARHRLRHLQLLRPKSVHLPQPPRNRALAAQNINQLYGKLTGY